MSATKLKCMKLLNNITIKTKSAKIGKNDSTGKLFYNFPKFLVISSYLQKNVTRFFGNIMIWTEILFLVTLNHHFFMVR